MDGPNPINNYTPLTVAPKLLTLQLPPMLARTTTSHNVAHFSPDRNIVLDNNTTISNLSTFLYRYSVNSEAPEGCQDDC